jgi:hypothetical protein
MQGNQYQHGKNGFARSSIWIVCVPLEAVAPLLVVSSWWVMAEEKCVIFAIYSIILPLLVWIWLDA